MAADNDSSRSESLETRLATIEQRLAAIEEALRIHTTGSPSALVESQRKEAPESDANTLDPSPSESATVAAEGQPPRGPQPATAPRADVNPIRSVLNDVPGVATFTEIAGSIRRKKSISPATVMAGGAAASFVLAAAYFLGLLIHSGWLTPIMQLLIAAAFGVGLILIGLSLARYDRRYASYLPAVGIIVLYLTVYAGQLFHRLLDPLLSTFLVCTVTAAALALGRQFKRDAYSICAVIGVYASPLLLHAGGPSQTIVVFYAVWCLVFCALAVQSGNRLVYLIAVYLAMFSFDAAYRMHGGREWMIHATFQLFQFIAFSVTAALISIRSRIPLTKSETIAHAPPLFYFYLLEYAILKENASYAFPWVGGASVVVVVGGYLIARRFLDLTKAEAGATLVSAYASIVTAHIVFFELLPLSWLPWGALALGVMMLIAFRQISATRSEWLPVWIVSAVVLLIGCGYALVDAFQGTRANTSPLILPVYAAVLYGTFWRLQRIAIPESASTLCLYSGHFALMVAAIRILDDQLLISIAWGLMAVLLLFIAWKARIRVLGQSSLFIFAVSALKVVIYDLSGSAPMIRIGVLLILAVSLYAGGWLYQQLARATARYHENDEVNEHIRQVIELSQKGMSSAEIANELTRNGVTCLAESGWTEEIIDDILRHYSPENASA